MPRVELPARHAVLRDLPLRTWALQQEHYEALLREFTVLLLGRQSGQATMDAPARLVSLADAVTERYGAIVDAVTAARQEAYDRGLDRMDSVVPLVEGTPAVIASFRDVFAAVDEYCREGHLLTLARPPEVVAFNDWSLDEIVAQYEGAEPTPWPGPF